MSNTCQSNIHLTRQYTSILHGNIIIYRLFNLKLFPDAFLSTLGLQNKKRKTRIQQKSTDLQQNFCEQASEIVRDIIQQVHAGSARDVIFRFNMAADEGENKSLNPANSDVPGEYSHFSL